MQGQKATAQFYPKRTPRQTGDRICPHTESSRPNCGLAAESGHGGAFLSRRAGRAHPGGEAKTIPARRRPDNRCDHCLRHGHRQTRRAVCGPSGLTGQHGSLLPGNRASRPGRAAGGRLDGLLPFRRCRHAQAAGPIRGGRLLQAHSAAKARRFARVLRGGRMPARSPAGLLRRKIYGAVLKLR